MNLVWKLNFVCLLLLLVNEGEEGSLDTDFSEV
jgi:hypothetical protein